MNANTYKLTEGQSFEEVKDLENYGIRVRTLNANETYKKLYLLVSQKYGSEEEHKMNGLIFEKESNKLVADAPEAVFENESVDKLNEFLTPDYEYDENGNPVNVYADKNDIRVEYAEDGTMVRLYYYDDSWHTATTRCISGKYSYWSNKNENFDKMFWDTVGDEADTIRGLDKSYTYNFLLKHTLNRLVVSHGMNELVWISKIKDGQETLDCPEEIMHIVTFGEHVNCSFLRFSDLERFDEFSEEERYSSWYSTETEVDIDLYGHNWSGPELEQLLIQSFSRTKKGIVFMRKCGGKYRRFMFETEQYKKIKSLKGNNPNVMWSFLDIYTKGTEEDLNTFSMVYAEHTIKFHEVSQKLETTIQEIYTKYVDSHIRQKYRVSESDKHHRSLRQLHAIHKQSRKPIHLDTVRDFMYTLDTKILMRLLGVEESRKSLIKPKRILKRGEVL